MFSSNKNQRIGDYVYTLRTVSIYRDEGTIYKGNKRLNVELLVPVLTMPCLGVDDQATEYAKRSLADANAFNDVILGDLYTSTCNSLILPIEKKEETSKNLKYWSHYLAERTCLIMERVLRITENKTLLNILSRLDEDYSSLSSHPSLAQTKGIMQLMIENFLRNSDEIKSLDIEHSFRYFSNFEFASFDKGYSSLRSHEGFGVIEKCLIHFNKLHSYLRCFSLNLAAICRFEEAKGDMELMYVLYPVYKDIECFLKEGERVDLSSVKEQCERKVARKTEWPEGSPSLDNTLLRAEMQQVLSQAIKNMDELLKVSEQHVNKLAGSAMFSQDDDVIQSVCTISNVTESKQKLEKLYEKCGFGSINNPECQNAIEGQEGKVTVKQ